jgi:hypothetical protein
LGEVVFPLLPGKVAYIFEASGLTDEQTVSFALEGSFTVEESCTDENDSCDEVDYAKDDQESKLICAAVAYFFDQIEESFRDFGIPSDLCLPFYLLSLLLGKGHLDL